MATDDGAAPPAIVTSSEVERRIVTVLFADLVGFTPLSERLDAEDVAIIQDAYFAAVRETIGRYGGQLEKFIGDAAMAVFGVPRARDDDPERAVRAGLALIGAVEQLGARLNLDEGNLRLRVGINTGEVVYAREGPDAGRVTGDTVNTAARLQAAADPGTVLLAEDAALAVADVIELGAVRLLELKGKAEPVRARPAAGVRAVRSRELAMGSLRAPTIGREGPLATLAHALERAVERAGAEGSTQLALVVAPPGVGKTRLVDEFERMVRERDASVLVRRVRLRPESVAGFEPLEALASAALDGIADDRALTQALAQAGLAPARAGVIAAELRSLAARGEASSPAASDAADRALRFDAWLDGLAALARQRAEVWLIEDGHWAGPDLLAFLDAATTRPSAGGRLLVVTARSSFLNAVPGWATDAPSAGRSLVELPTLAASDAASLVRALVGDALPEVLVDRIVERSDGNCLFIEELLRTWVGTAALVPVEAAHRSLAGWRLAVPADDAALPPSVQAIYAAQLDDLPSGARQVARRGAVAGRRFPIGALRSLGVGEPGEAVDELVRRALVGGPHPDQVAGDTFAYRHALLRDAGYASLARAERAELHVRLARWLESAAGEHPDAVAAAIGEHLATAVQTAPALAAEVAPGVPRSVLATEAAAWLDRAGRSALADGALASAASLFRRALELTPQDAPAERSRRFTRLGRAVVPIGGVDEAERSFRSAMDAARAARDPSGSWRVLLADATEALCALLFERIRFVEAWQLGDAALAEMGEADDLPTARVRLARSRGRTGETNDASGWVDDAERALALARAAGDADAEYEFVRDLARARSEAGSATAQDWIALSELARARGDHAAQASARVMEAAYRLMDEPAAAEAILAPAREIAVAHGLVERLGWIEHATAEAAFATGDWDTTLEAGLRAVELAERHGYDRIAVRSWTTLLPAASLRGVTRVLERAAAWFDARRGALPDSPYGRVLHAACGLWIAAGQTGPDVVPSLDQIRPAFPQWLAQGGFEWLASCDAIVDSWLAAGRLDWVAQLVSDASVPGMSIDPSPATPAAFELVRLRLDLAGGEAVDPTSRARRQLDILRRIGLPYWIARTLRVLEATGVADPAVLEEREAIERRLGVVRPTLAG
jgi:class 3 adenylate cyclase/tetratricopeptide (TPR) repeat protein